MKSIFAGFIIVFAIMFLFSIIAFGMKLLWYLLIGSFTVIGTIFVIALFISAICWIAEKVSHYI